MTVSSSRPISTDHWLAFVWWLLIMYKARNRSRVRGCSASIDSRRKSAEVWPHLAVSGRTISVPPFSESRLFGWFYHDWLFVTKILAFKVALL
jgi:hypothetical protein